MKKKIYFRLLGITILAILATMMGITIVYYSLFEAQIRSDLSISVTLLEDTNYFSDSTISPDAIDSSFVTAKELRVTWIAEDGTVLFDNDADVKHLENHFYRPEVQAAITQGTGESIRKSNTMNKNTFYYAKRLENGTILRVATDARSIWSVMASSAPMILLIGLVIMVICSLLAHMLTRQLIHPIEIMAQQIEDVQIRAPYKELEPFANTIRQQHADILSAARVRQDFTANVSHELKTPLTAISGYAELLESGMVQEEKKLHFYQEIRKSANRLLSLINDIIQLSELDRGSCEQEFVLVNLREVVNDCMDNLQMNAQKHMISLEFEGDDALVRGNRNMLMEMVENLVQNAIRYNNPGGYVRIQVLQKDGIRLVIKDNGIGIPASEQDRIFERFYRVDKSRSKETGGTGLGLAIVKHIVELHSAVLELDSAPGVGTTIQIIF